MIIKGRRAFHSIECLLQHTHALEAKAKAKKLAKMYLDKKHKRRDKSDLQRAKEAAKKACHAYIRARDNGQRCICCNRSTEGVKTNAGHYFESSQYPYLRYHEDNIHLQRVDCNHFKSGNLGDYRTNLIKKIGEARFNFLEANKSTKIVRTEDDYRLIEASYKEKLACIKDR